MTYEFHMGITTPDNENQYVRLVGSPKLFTVTEIWAQVINKLALEPPYARIYNLGGEDIIIHIGVDHDGQVVDYERQVLEDKWEIYGDKEGIASREEIRGILPDIELPPIPSPLAEEAIDLETIGLEPPQTRVRITLRTGQIINFKDGGYHQRRREQVRSERRRRRGLYRAGILGPASYQPGYRAALLSRGCRAQQPRLTGQTFCATNRPVPQQQAISTPLRKAEG